MTDPRLVLFLRAGAGLVVLTGLIAWLWVMGSARARRLFGPGDGDIRPLASVTWACSILTLSAMLLGSFGALQPVNWVALALVGGLLLGRRGGVPWLEPGRAHRANGPAPPGPSWWFGLGTAAVVIGRLLFGLRNPPADLDSLIYHIPMAAHWLATGGLGVAQFQPQQVSSYYPGNVELLALGFAWAGGRETLMTVPGVLSLGMLAFALRALAIEAGSRRSMAEVVALGLACAPGVVQLTLGVRVDNIMAAWFAVALLFALRARRSRAHGDVEAALCAIGLLGGSKAIGPALAAFAFAALLAGTGLRTRFASVLRCRFGLGAMAVTGGFWMVRNTLASGNPAYPAVLSLGPWTLPGLASDADLLLTSQLAMWRAGLPGHLSLANLWKYVGPIGLLLATGVVAGMAVAVLPRRPGGRPAALRLMLVVALAATALTIVQPFSGANEPAVPGATHIFSLDNVRCLMPTLVALVPVAAVGLSSLPALPVVAAGLVLACLGSVPHAGHLLPGLGIALLVGVVWTMRRRLPARSRAWRFPLALTGCALLAAAVTVVEPLRQQLEDHTWDSYLKWVDSVPSGLAHELRMESGGRPIAVAGTYSVWALYGREFDGRPEYVPVAAPLSEAREPWRFRPDRRASADAGLWKRNLEISGAPFVVLMSGERLNVVERAWCESDPSHFVPVYLTPTCAVYRVTEP
jgi:hypothetical protein